MTLPACSCVELCVGDFFHSYCSYCCCKFCTMLAGCTVINTCFTNVIYQFIIIIMLSSSLSIMVKIRVDAISEATIATTIKLKMTTIESRQSTTVTLNKTTGTVRAKESHGQRICYLTQCPVNAFSRLKREKLEQLRVHCRGFTFCICSVLPRQCRHDLLPSAASCHGSADVIYSHLQCSATAVQT